MIRTNAISRSQLFLPPIVAGLALLFFVGCNGDGSRDVSDADNSETEEWMDPNPTAEFPLTQYVDPFIGTGGIGFNDIGSAYPGPQTPFGMIKPGPDTSNGLGAIQFQHCSGFNADDDWITGFSHARLHGAGIVDYGSVGLMPVREMDDDYVDRYGRQTRFTSRSASPGYYETTIARDQVHVELTASARVAAHRYTFPQGQEQTVLLDASHVTADDIDIYDAAVEIDVDENEVSGSTHFGGGYSRRHGGTTIYFVARFNRDISGHGVWEGTELKADGDSANDPQAGAWVIFDSDESDELVVEIAISYVDVEGARKNLDAETTEFDFDERRAAAEDVWNEWLSRVRVSGPVEDDFTHFYTALYHSLQMPTLATDVDGRYRGLDKEIHVAEGFDYYTDFSLWDTFRTLHPLLTLLYPDVQRDMLESLNAMVRDGGAMPRWPLGTGYTGGMLGEPAAIVFADSWSKGIQDIEIRTSWEAMMRSREGEPSENFPGRGSGESWSTLNYVSTDSAGGSVSKTQEFAYADWALARLADALGETDAAASLDESAGNWRNVYDTSRGYFIGRDDDGAFSEDFTTTTWESFYTEGNALQYLWYVPHDLHGLAEIMGGEAELIDRLRQLFVDSVTEVRWLAPPVYYWHGNEPDIHAPYIFAELGYPVETARYTRWIMREIYGLGYDGLPGNDDSGTLSSWLVFSAMGIFPIAGRDDYLLGSPLFSTVEVTTPSGTFNIRAADASDASPVIERAALNGDLLESQTVRHEDLIDGGTLTYEMGPDPEPIR